MESQNKIPNITGIRIKEMRLEKNWTQKDLATKLGLKNETAIANYESGYSLPKDDIKLKICEIFDCTMDYLMGKSSQKNILQNENSLEDVKKHYEEKINVALKNKYIGEFLKLGLKNSEVDNLMKILTSEDEEITQNYITILDDLFRFLSSSYDENTIKKIKDLILAYNDEKLIVLTEQQQFLQKKHKIINQQLIDEHIDELHPSISGKTSASLDENLHALLNYLDKYNIDNFYMCPVYGHISAGEPNWAEESIEGRMPIDLELMNIINPEEYFFLHVNGESMNKVIKNGAYALIHKQDVVEDGEIAVVLVNGYDATLKKFTKQNDLIILEPQSDDPSFTTQVYDKNTNIKILGKYVGKMEFNK